MANAIIALICLCVVGISPGPGEVQLVEFSIVPQLGVLDR